MLNLSNFEFFKRARKVDQRYLKRVAFLESQIKALQEYHNRLADRKGTVKRRRVIIRLIVIGESLLDNAHKKIGA